MKVKGIEVKVQFEFDVYYSGWECDSAGYVVIKSDGRLGLVLSNHGTPYFAEGKELSDFIAEYKLAISNMEHALELIK